MIRTTFIAAALVAASSLAAAQDAIPANDWTNSALRSAQAASPVTQASSSGTRVEVTAKRQPGAFQDVAGERGSAHIASLSGRSRAEVLADLQIYRESGLARLDAGESPDFTSSAYLEAQQRYAQLRSSQYFAQLVQRFA